MPVSRKLVGCAGVFLAALVAASSLPADPAHAQDKKKGTGGPKHVFSCPPPEHPFDVILARPTDTSVTVSVLAYKATEVYVTYGTSSGKLTERTDTRSLKPDTPAEFVLKGLKPDTRYHYRLHTRTGDAKEFATDAERSFHTQRKPGGPFVFTVQSDSHLDQASRPAVDERTLANALADRPDFHIDVGDTFMTEWCRSRATPAATVFATPRSTGTSAATSCPRPGTSGCR